MDGEVIKSFLVGLGFGVDDASLAKFNKSIASAALKVTALYAAIQVAAAGIFASISGVSSDFEDLGYQLRIVAPAMNRWLVMRAAMLQAYSKAGVNLTQVVQSAIKFNYALAKVKFTLEAIYKGTAAKFFPLLTKQLDIFRQKIYANMPKIQAALKGFIEFIFSAFKATYALGERAWAVLTRVWNFFVKLDKATNGWSTIILGVAAAWELLNLSFSASPLGTILSLAAAILIIYDDFMTFKEGGKSFINWGSETTKIIGGLVLIFGTLTAAIKAGSVALSLYNAVLAIFDTEEGIALAPLYLFLGVLTSIVSLLTIADKKWKIFGGNLSGGVSDLFDRFGNFFSGGNNGPQQPYGPQQPLLPANGGNKSVNVNQNVTNNINGAPDAHAVGKEVNSGIGRGIQDSVRYGIGGVH